MSSINQSIAWKKSSHSSTNGGECVEVATVSGGVSVRDSKNPDGAILHLAPLQWRMFLRHVKRIADAQ
jgi:hypothetical protein